MCSTGIAQNLVRNFNTVVAKYKFTHTQYIYQRVALTRSIARCYWCKKQLCIRLDSRGTRAVLLWKFVTTADNDSFSEEVVTLPFNGFRLSLGSCERECLINRLHTCNNWWYLPHATIRVSFSVYIRQVTSEQVERRIHLYSSDPFPNLWKALPLTADASPGFWCSLRRIRSICMLDWLQPVKIREFYVKDINF